jgi:hypothetical protein
MSIVPTSVDFEQRDEQDSGETSSSFFIDRNVKSIPEQKHNKNLRKYHSFPAPKTVKVVVSGLQSKSLALRIENRHIDPITLELPRGTPFQELGGMIEARFPGKACSLRLVSRLN